MREGGFSREASIVSGQAVKEKEYWLKKLSDQLERSVFYRDNVRGEGGKANVTFGISGEVFSRLIKLSKGLDYTLHMVLVSVVTLLLHKYTGNRDIIVGAPIYKQEKDSGFVNTVLALRNQVESDMTFKDVLLRVRQGILEAEENQNYPIETLIYHLNLPPTGNEFPLFDVVVLLENIHEKEYIWHINPNVIFSFIRKEKEIEGILEYNASMYGRETIERIAAHFLHLLGQLLRDIHLKIGSAELLSAEEKKQLLVDFNDTVDDYAAGDTLVDIFERQVEYTPHRVAVFYENRLITYRELNKRANQLARLLRTKGVKPNTLVGIMVDRTIDTVIGIIAVLKAGGGYLPVDPEAPVSRRESMLEDGRVSILLAKSTILKKFIFTRLQGLRRFNAKPFLTAPRPPVKNLDGLPPPDRSLVDYGKYNRHIGQSMARHIIAVQATRGCPYRCAYCHKIWPKKHVYRSAEHIFSEVKLNVDMGMNKFAFVDDIFNLNRENSMKFFELVINSGLNRHVQFFFPNGLRGDILNKEYIDLMVEAGTVSCALALETGSPRVQKLIGKNLDLEKFRENIEYLCNTYPNVILELFTMHGFPSETEEEALMTLNFIKRLKWVHFPYINMLKIYPNTGMEQLALQHGVTRESIFRSENYAHFEVSDNLTLEKSFTLNYRSDFLYNYFLLKERLLHVLPHQVKILTGDEIVQKYNSYLPIEISSFDELLKYLDITGEELTSRGADGPLSQDIPSDFPLKWKERSRQLAAEPSAGALRVLLLDLSQFFSDESEFFYDVMGEAPLGMMYLLTYLNHRFGRRIRGKIAKSRMDFDNYHELKVLVEEFRPDVIGLRSLNIYKDFFHKTLSIMRQWGIQVPVIAGGPYPTSDLNTVLQDRNVDLVVLGEGEITFSEVIEAIMNNSGKLPGEEELKKIKGIAFIPATTGETREIFMLDALESVLAGEPTENLPHVNRSTDLAYTIFTSGSTGKPKGVMIGHGNVHNLVHGLKERIYKEYAPGGYLKVGMVSPFVFDASVKQVFGALMQGYGLCIIPDDVRVDIERLYEFYNKHFVDVSDGTPAHIVMLTEAMRGNASRPRVGVKHFLIGGEVLSWKIVEDFFSGFSIPGAFPRITNVYGPTECSVDTTAYEVPGQTADRFDEIPIGFPMPNFSVYILDNHNEPVPIGVPGELCISGAGVGRGYLNRPELTNEKFDQDLQDYQDYHDGYHRSYRSHRSYIYRTGDLARWLPDGNIAFVGRKDQQVKVRGFRIELGEIESRLVRHKEVKEAVVLIRESRESDKYLCAYIVGKVHPGRERAVDFSELREYLSRELPEYMIPSYFVPLEKIPLTFNGKVDRRALPEPEIGDTGVVYEAPRDHVEEKLAALWSEVLKIDKKNIGINSNFFEIGGHSLRATILIAKIHKAFDIRVPLQEIFKAPFIKGMSGYIKENRPEDRFSSLKPAPERDYYKLSSAQERLYFLQQMAPDSTSYNLLVPVLLEGSLDLERLEGTFLELIRRHESLRTSFEIVDNEPMQHISPDVAFSLKRYEMGEEEVALFLDRDFIKPFDLSKAPLFRAVVIKVGKDRHVLAASLHHIISDGTSLGILMKEFMALYEGETLPPLRIQYKDYSEAQNSNTGKEIVKKQEVFWLKQFEGGVPVLDLPTDFSRPPMQCFEGSLTRFRIEKDKTRKIKEAAARQDVTLYMFLLAAFNTFLFKITGQEDIPVGSPVAGRRHADLQAVVGLFVNMLVMRNYPKAGLTFRDFLRDVRKTTMAAFENQDYKFEDLVEQVVEEVDPSRNPLFNVSFALQNMEIPVIEISGLRLVPFDYTTGTSRFDLCFIAYEDGEELGFMVEYSTRLFKEETIGMFIENLNQVIASVLENKDILLKDIPIASGVVSAAANIPQLDLGF